MKTFLRTRGVASRYSINKRSVTRWAQDGRLPKPVYRGRIPTWDVDELDESDRRAMAERESLEAETGAA